MASSLPSSLASLRSRLPGQLGAGVRRTAFVFVVAVIAAVGSERMFWFWSTGVLTHLEVGLFYGIAAAVALWAIERYSVSGWWSLWLATPLFALVVEGVITPVVYSGGPLVPIFPAWFALWHGVLAFGGLVIGVRHLLLSRRTAVLAWASTGLGVFWGLWSTTLWLPENLEDPELLEENGVLEILTPSSFTAYAVVFTAVLAIGHVALGWLWPTAFRPARATKRFWGALVVVGAAVWTVAYPWALPMFLAYGWLQIWGLKRHERVAEPSLFVQLSGPTPLRPVAALIAMPIAAVATYAAMWELDPSPSALRVVMWTTIAIQTIAGFAITGAALRRAGRRRDRCLAPMAPAQSAVAVEVETRSGPNNRSAGLGLAK